MIDPDRPDLVASVVGAGLMGRGIAQIAALGGARVLLQDVRANAAVEARESVRPVLARLVEKGSLAAAVDAAIARIEPVAAVDALAPCRDPRYRPSPWLVRRAKLGVSLATPEAA